MTRMVLAGMETAISPGSGPCRARTVAAVRGLAAAGQLLEREHRGMRSRVSLDGEVQDVGARGQPLSVQVVRVTGTGRSAGTIQEDIARVQIARRLQFGRLPSTAVAVSVMLLVERLMLL